MTFFSKPAKWIGLLTFFLISIPAQAAMVDTSDLLLQSERARIVSLMQQEDIQHKLEILGVDQISAITRVNQMTQEELAQIQAQIDELPAGAGVSTTDLLLIILLVVLLL
jgi:hypothetical protein